MCVSTINEICVEMNVPFYTSRHFKAEKTVDELKRLLYDLNALNRWAAVDSLAEKNHKDIVPKLIEVIKHDNSLCVRRAAYQALSILTGQPFEKLQLEQWNA